MNYPDFLAKIDQLNQPPSANETMNFWIKNGGIKDSSVVLDLACSTGFSAKLISAVTNCKTYGIDISEDAIKKAKKIKLHEDYEIKTEFIVGNATDLPFSKDFFSHIIAGSNFGFIQLRDRGLDECFRVLKSQGKLLVSNYYYEKKPPIGLLDSVELAIGYRPSEERNLFFWKEFYNKHFELEHEFFSIQSIMDEENLKIAVQNSIENSKTSVTRKDFDRLLDIRKILNEHRSYQKIFIAVYKTKL